MRRGDSNGLLLDCHDFPGFHFGYKVLVSRYQGHIGTYLIMGGVDVTGPHLYEIAAHGSTSKVLERIHWEIKI